MKKFNIVLLVACLTTGVFGQDVTRGLSQKEANDLRKSLDQPISEGAKVNTLLRLAMFNILKEGNNKVDLDSAASYITAASPLLNRQKVPAYDGFRYFVESNLCRERGQQASGKSFAEKAVASLKNTNDKYHLGLAYFELGQYCDESRPEGLKQKILLLEQAANTLQHSTSVELYAFVLKFLAELYLADDSLEKATKTIQQSLSSYQSIHYLRLQGVYTTYGSIYYCGGNYRQALKYMLEAQKSADLDRDTSMQLCQIKNYIGLIYSALGERANGIPYFINAIQIAERNRDPHTIMFLMTNVVESYNRMGQYRNALQLLDKIKKKMVALSVKPEPYEIPQYYLLVYTNLKQYDKASAYCAQLLARKDLDSKDAFDLSNLYGILIRYYIGTGRYELAHKYLHKDNSKIKALGDPFRFQEHYFLAFRLDSAQENFKGAMDNLILFRKIKDSLFNELKSKQMKELQVQYETEKKVNELKIKDQNIRFLNQRNLLQQSKLQQANLLRDVTIAGILALFAIMFLLLRQYVHKQKNNRIVQANNIVITQKNALLERLLKEKEWLLKEVHHRVKNNLHTVICLLESQAAYLENDALKAIENSQHRIYAMSLIHQKLYQSEDIKTIDMSFFLPEFASYLNEAFGTQRQIRFQLDIEAIKLGVSQAIPIALIINEAVTNSIKYAFPGKRKGVIVLSMHQDADLIAFDIADDGIGIDPAIAKGPLESLGLKLMHGLSEDINAKLSVFNDNGTRIRLSFSVDPLVSSDGNSLAISQSELCS